MPLVLEGLSSGWVEVVDRVRPSRVHVLSHGRGAGAVRAKQAEQLSGVHVEGDVVDGHHFSLVERRTTPGVVL